MYHSHSKRKKTTTKYQHKVFLSPPQSFNFRSEHQFSIINTPQCRMSIFEPFNTSNSQEENLREPTRECPDRMKLVRVPVTGGTLTPICDVSPGSALEETPPPGSTSLAAPSRHQGATGALRNQPSLNDSDGTPCQQLLVKTSYLSLSCYVREAGT